MAVDVQWKRLCVCVCSCSVPSHSEPSRWDWWAPNSRLLPTSESNEPSLSLCIYPLSHTMYIIFFGDKCAILLYILMTFYTALYAHKNRRVLYTEYEDQARVDGD